MNVFTEFKCHNEMDWMNLDLPDLVKNAWNRSKINLLDWKLIQGTHFDQNWLNYLIRQILFDILKMHNFDQDLIDFNWK